MNRWLTSLMVRYKGRAVLIDCGEGTQIAAQRAGVSLKPIDKLLITHLHADHISGLPGLLHSMSNAGRTEELSIIGPVGTERVVAALRSIANNLPFEVKVSELETDEEDMFFLDCDIHAFSLMHRIACYGYSISLPRAGKFDVQKAQAAGVPTRLWNRLQKGETLELDGQVFTPEMVMGPPRKGLKVTYCTDTRPTSAIAEAATGSDLFICEGMYGDPEMLPKAKERKHMLFTEAAELASKAEAQELWLTHFSPAMPNPKSYLDHARAIFPKAYVPRDGWSKTLAFEKEGEE